MTVRVLLGVDVGTTSAKGAAFDLEGRLLAQETIGYAHRAPAAGWAEADADAWWDAGRHLLGALAARAGGRVEAVGVTGQAPTLLAVDADGHPLAPAILWLDMPARAAPPLAVDAAAPPLAPAILWLDMRAEAEAATLAASMGPRAEAIGGNR